MPPRFKPLWLTLVACAAVVGGLLWFSGPKAVRVREEATSTSEPALRPVVPRVASPSPQGVAKGMVPEVGKARAEFTQWTERFLAAPVAERPVLENEGIRLAKARRPEFKSLIISDPRRALVEAVPMVVRQQLPASVLAWLERRIADKGTLRIYQSTPAPGTPVEKAEPSVLRYAELKSGETLRARVYGRREQQVRWTAGASLNGVAVDSDFAVNESPIRPLEIGEIPDAAKIAVQVCPVSNKVTAAVPESETISEATPAVEAFGEIVYLCDGSHTTIFEQTLLQGEGVTGGPQQFTGILPAGPTPSIGTIKVLYLPVTFADQNAVPSSEATAYDLLRRVNDFYNKASYGKLTMVAVVTPPIKLPHDEAWYKQKDTSDGSTGNKEIDGLGMEHSHARDEARKLGYDSNDYSCIVVRLNGGPRATGGWGGGSSVWIYGDSDSVTAHEIGHVFGLAHANYWDTGGASAIGPGANQEYGDQYDVMGGGPFPKNHYNAQAKSQIRWLPADFIQTITTSGTYRLYAYDQPSLRAGQRYALKVVKDAQRTYWGEFRQLFEGTNNWAANGMLLGWNWPTNSGSNVQLIDTTPGSPGAKDDAAIYLGRTFSDFESGIHFTTVAVNQGDPKSLDVVVNIGTFPTNQPPTLSVAASSTSVPLNTPITFTATAADPDGDALAYAWQCSDNTAGATALIGPNAPTFTRSFATSGQYLVSCTVSDMKGGSATRNVVITAGTGGGRFTISGRVTAGGYGLPGVLLSTGSNNAVPTDADGYYTIPGLAAGTYTVVPQLYGYTFIEQFNNSLTLGPAATGADFEAEVTPGVSISAAADAVEGATPTVGRFTLTRFGGSEADLVVRLLPAGGTASSGDYALAPVPTTGSPYNFVTIPAGQETLDITVTPTNDSTQEGPETVLLSLGLDPAYVIEGAQSATVTIADDDTANPKVSIVASTLAALENPPTPTTFTVSRTGSTGTSLPVNFTVSGTATAGADYTAIGTSVVIPAGASSANVTITPIDDSVSEQAETVILTLAAGTYVIDSTASSATAKIMDDDLQVVSLSVTDATATEVDLTVPGAKPDPATFLVTRTGDLSQELIVYYGVSGTALHGVDYDALPGSVRFPPGQDKASVTITPRYDLLGEGPETVVLQLGSGATNFVLGPQNSGTITINDAADKPYVEVLASANAAEPSTAGNFRFTTKGAGTGTIQVHYTISGTAVAGTDYTIAGLDTATLKGAVAVTLVNGTATTNLAVTPINDALAEELETITLTIDDDAAYQTWAPSHATTMWVRDDEQPTVFADGYISPSAANTLAESATTTTAKFWLSRTGATTAALTVNYSFVAGAGYATPGVDFTGATGIQSVTIPAGATGVDVVVSPVIQDTLAEGTEKITLHLEPGSYGRGADSTIYITDDDTNTTTVQFDTAASSGTESTTNVNIPVSLNAAATGPVTVEYLVDTGSKATTSVNATPAAPLWVRVVRSGTSFSSYYSSDGVNWVQQGATQTVSMSSTSYLVGLAACSGSNTVAYNFSYDNVTVTGLTGGTQSGLTSLDINAGSNVGATTGTGPAYTLTAYGTGFGTATTDSYRYAFFTISNSTTCTLTARVVSHTAPSTATSARFGVMMRETTANNAREVASSGTWTNNSNLSSRATAGGTPTTSVAVLPLPQWFRLVRAGNTVTASTSTDGVAWVQVGTPQTLAIGAPALAGLVACSHNDGTLTTAVFDHVSITPTPADGFASQDIGFVSAAGSANVAGGVYTLTGSGADITGTADEFQFYRVPIVGDCTLVARVVSLVNTNTNAKAGIMIRDSSSGYGRHVYTGWQPSNTPQLIARSTTVTNAFGAGVDYTLAAGTLNFTTGDITKNIPLVINNDTLPEGSKTITLLLRNPNGAGLGTRTTHAYTIVDDDVVSSLPAVGFAAPSSSSPESEPNPQVLVSLGAPSENSVSVDYHAEVTGTATAGVDFTLPDGTLTFAAGETIKALPLTVLDDAVVEPDETVIITLKNPSNGVLSTSNQHTFTITDDDRPVVTINATTPNAAEPSTTGIFKVSRTGPTTAALTVKFTTATGTGQATPGTDYTAIGTSVVIPAGSAVATILVAVINDSLVEGNETVALTLAADAAYTVGAQNSATVTIQDDDIQTVSVTATTPNASETGPTPGVFTFTRVGSTASALTVNFAVSGTATSGSDFTSIGTSKVIPAGASSATVTVTPINDTLTEGPEQVIVSISTSANYLIGSSSFATVTIADNDSPPTLFISDPPVKAVQLASGNGLYLQAQADDDGAPSPLTLSWSKFSGPGTVTFDAPNAAATGAKFSADGVYILRVAASDGFFTVYDEITVQVGGFAPLDWVDVSIGAPGVRGMSGDSAGVISMVGSGTGFLATTDSAHLSARQISGDGSIVARVTSLPNTSAAGALAGVMMRETSYRSARRVFLGVKPSGAVEMHVRPTGNAADVTTTGSVAVFPVWLKIERVGDVFTMSQSADASGSPGTWSVVGSSTIVATANWLAGLSASNSTANTVCTATFDHRTLTPTPVGPALIDEDLAAVAPLGSSSDNGGTVTINAAGSLGDAGHFRYRQYVGDVTVTARAISHTGSGFNTKGGVMIRDFSGDNAPYGMLGIAHYWGPYFVYRTVNAGGAGTNYGGSNTYPQWTRMVRRGAKMTAWRATDTAGSPGTWTQRGAELTLAAGAPVWVGLAADGDTGTAVSNTVVMSNLTVTPGNLAPNCNPGLSRDVFGGGSVPLAGAVTDDGSFTAQWTQLSGPGTLNFANANAANTTATYTVPGVYVLRLSANDGELSTFADVTLGLYQNAYQKWQVGSFPVGASKTGPNEDYDSDGLDNLSEYLMGTPPRVPNVSPAVIDTETIGTDTFLRLTVPKNPAATDAQVTVMGSSNPANSNSWSSTGLVIEQNTTTLLQVRDNVPIGSMPARLLRARITH